MPSEQKNRRLDSITPKIAMPALPNSTWITCISYMTSSQVLKSNLCCPSYTRKALNNPKRKQKVSQAQLISYINKQQPKWGRLATTQLDRHSTPLAKCKQPIKQAPLNQGTNPKSSKLIVLNQPSHTKRHTMHHSTDLSPTVLL
ncbi:hypothetical protein M758_9G112200 [Ceratodon purpureus]|nr:hypothetical protein M758_9G112200 [Ceratodon purpureus]